MRSTESLFEKYNKISEKAFMLCSFLNVQHTYILNMMAALEKFI